MFEQRIKDRQKIRDTIAHRDRNRSPDIFLLISESLDDYIEHRIKTDQVLKGILTDIERNTASLAEKNNYS